MTIKEAHEGLTNKKFSATELTEEILKKIDRDDKDIHAYLKVDEEGSLNTAKLVDRNISEGVDIDPLAGIPVAIKDNILVKGQQATAASQILKDYIASYDATVSKRLRDQNAILIGKTNLD